MSKATRASDTSTKSVNPISMTQDEVNDDIGWHAKWLVNPRTGMQIDWSHCTLKRLDLAGVDLRGAIMTGTSFVKCDLVGANLRNVDLTGGAKMNRVNAESADFSESCLTNLQAIETNFSRVKFVGARCAGTDYIDCDCTEADFTGRIWA